MSLRPYQVKAIDETLAAFRAHQRRVLVQMATGCGKTVFFSELARLCKSNVLMIAERRDLIEQTADRMSDWCNEAVGIEMADRRDATQPGFARPRIVCGSVQTLVKRHTAIQFDWPGLVIVDEAHHAVAKTYRDVLDYFSRSCIVGVTATPDRSDEKALGRVFSDGLVFEYPIGQAITDGWLAPIKQYLVRTEIDFSKVRTTAGDFNAGDLETAMRHEAALTAIAAPLIEQSCGRPTMAFTVTVAHAYDLARVLNARTGTPNFAAALDGSSPPEERRRVIDAAKRGDIKCLVNCQLLTEGFDWPAIEVLAMARPTKSRSAYTQMLGRGTRLSPETGKTYLTVLDYTGNCDRHSLVTAIDIFAGEFSDEVAQAATDEAEERQELLDVRELLAISHNAVVAKHARVKYELAARDPFLSVGIDPDAYSDGIAATPATEKQIELLAKHGFKAKNISKAKASKIIGQLMQRFDEGLCTPKQGRVLRKAGIDPARVTRESANAWITQIMANGYRPPESVIAQARESGVLLEEAAHA